MVFLTGGTGYIGSRAALALVARGHEVLALARPGSMTRLPPGVQPIEGDALGDYAAGPCDVFVHLIGVAHPGPGKGAAFRAVDLRSAERAVRAAEGARHFVYVSVAHPAPVMREYVEARVAGEALVRALGKPATILRPWYVVGPGHWWPVVLWPAYKLAEGCGSAAARRLGLVTIAEMVAAVVAAVERPAEGVRVWDVEAIRGVGRLQ